MLPHRKNEPHEDGDGVRAGFEVRVIGGARPTPEPGRGKGLEIGLQIGPGQTSASAAVEDPSAAPVQRLQAEGTEPLRARTISEVIGEVGPAAPYVPRHRSKERSLTAWTLWMAAGTCTLAVAAVAGVMSMKKKPSNESEQAIVFAPQDSFGEEKAYFLDHMGPLTHEAETLLKKYAAATSPEAVLPLVRDAARVKERLMALWQPMGELSKDLVETSISDSEVRPALILRGKTAGFANFEMAFVREGGQLKIDWEATEGIGDAQLSELRKSKTVVKGAKVRVVAQPGNFYTPEFPEADYRSYQLLDAAGEEFVWAFVRRSSTTANSLEAELNESSVLLEKTRSVPATLRISGPLREGVNLFEITEMLHKGWVSP
ncbi:hypothetical protein [Luteolibacter soli]|uniref:Uncharacterized protein n=1 Tax=Luteolibacter soli TaxID=3135280 RepID=A0ABU9B3Z0_9BACT